MRFPLRTLFCAICLAVWLSSFVQPHDASAGAESCTAPSAATAG